MFTLKKICFIATIALVFQHAMTAGNCNAPRCAECFGISDQFNSCSLCYNSVFNDDKTACTGESTGIENCSLFQIVTSSSSGQSNRCKQCDSGFHANNEASTTVCYPDSEKRIENCAYEVFSLPTFGGGAASADCKYCANGFNTLNEFNGSECVAGTEVPNCFGMKHEAGKCALCMPDYYPNDAGQCVERTTVVELACASGTNQIGENGGRPYCAECNVAKGYYSVGPSLVLTESQICAKFRQIFMLGISMLIMGSFLMI